MRIAYLARDHYRYEHPPSGVIQTLRLTPRDHDGQYVVRWRIDVSQDCRLDQHEDAFGNIIHAFTADGPFAELARAWSKARSRPRIPTASCAARSSAFRPACSCARPRSPRPTGDRGASHARRRQVGGDDALAILHALLDRAASRDRLRSRSDPRRPPRRPRLSRSSAACARTSPISSSRPRAASASRRAMSAAIFTAPTGWSSRTPATPGRRPMSATRLGRLRPGQRHLRDRCPCAGRGRPRLSRRRAGARHPLRRRRRGAYGAGSGSTRRAPTGAELTQIAGAAPRYKALVRHKCGSRDLT